MSHQGSWYNWGSRLWFHVAGIIKADGNLLRWRSSSLAKWFLE